MKASFTAGPWVVHPERAWVCPAGALDRPVCELRHPAKDLPESQVRATAELIAEAPALLKALRDLEIAANTVGGCYTRNPGNFAAALRDLREYAENARTVYLRATGDTP